MHIGFDAKRIFQNTTGLGNYSRSIVKNLADFFPENEYYLFTPSSKRSLQFLSKKNIYLVVGKGSVWRSFGIRRDLIRHDIELYHGLTNEIPFTLKNSTIKSVVTIHDLIFEHYPEHYPGIDRKFYDLKSKFAVRHADRIIAASESTKKDISRFYETDPEKVKVVYQSCDDIFYKQFTEEDINAILKKYPIPSEFILCVGSITERKNLMVLCRAYATMPEKERIPCIIVGRGSEYTEQLKEYIGLNKLEKYFYFLDTVPTEHLPAFYRKALLFIYPSLYEGFGIPVIESMACRCPVLTSNTSSLPEAGGDAAYYFNPRSETEIISGITKLLSDSGLRERMIEKGLEHIKSFDKKKITNDLMNIYTSI